MLYNSIYVNCVLISLYKSWFIGLYHVGHLFHNLGELTLSFNKKLFSILYIDWYINEVPYPFSSQRKLYYTFDQDFCFKMWRDHRKIPYDHRVYEWVDDRSLS